MRADNGIEVRGAGRRSSRRGPGPSTGSSSTVAPGEIYGFLGPNGAGKSTTVHMLTTLLPPTAGTARVAGHDIVKEGPAVRDAIGVALQEAALDQYLTAREHMRLQAGMHGIPKAEALRRGDELIERVGLTDAADRKVGGYSGGMRRRLDLALALVHGPRLLFLDEPTTGLDVQSRTALWDEVARLCRRRWRDRLPHHPVPRGGRLARRPGRDHRHRQDRRRGHARALKAEIGRPTVEAAPLEEGELERMRAVLARFGSPQRAERGHVAVRLDEGSAELADVVRALDAEGIAVRDLEIHAPTLDDVFLAKTGRRLEGAAARPTSAKPAAPVSWRQCRRERDRRSTAGRGARARPDRHPDPGRLPGRTLDHAHVRQPILFVPSLVFPLFLLAVNSSGLEAATSLPGLPDRLLPELRARAHLHAGGAVRDHGRRPVDRRRHPARVLQPPAADPAARLGAARRPARRGHRSRG